VRRRRLSGSPLRAAKIGSILLRAINVPRYFALVPAAGSGSRLGNDLPKQYSLLAGRPLVYYALRRLALHASIEQVFVVLAPGDDRFRSFDWTAFEDKLSPLYCGGETRAASVFNGLVAANDTIGPNDWVLVHDAARPCLSASALQRLIDEASSDDAGGLLAVPVADTLKRADAAGRVAETAPRESLWQAQTPQMFRHGILVEALRRCGPSVVTDEASAVERVGLKPKLVRGEARNLKVTYAEDLELASVILERDTTVEPGRA
jgi:2-C-methyl-D-erythritol 4-phosphate cytidylyltransferase